MESKQELILPGASDGRVKWDRDAVIERVERRMINGESMKAICSNMRRDPKTGEMVLVDTPDLVPDRYTILRWLNDLENGGAAYATRIARAREMQADAYASDIMDIAARVVAGEIEPKAGAVAINALQWTARHLRPRKYHIGPPEPDGGSGGSEVATQLKLLAAQLPG